MKPIEPDYSGMDADQLLHLLKLRDRQARLSRKYWIRAAKKAFDGDTGELRNRLALAESPDFEIVQSERG